MVNADERSVVASVRFQVVFSGRKHRFITAIDINRSWNQREMVRRPNILYTNPVRPHNTLSVPVVRMAYEGTFREREDRGLVLSKRYMARAEIPPIYVHGICMGEVLFQAFRNGFVLHRNNEFIKINQRYPSSLPLSTRDSILKGNYLYRRVEFFGRIARDFYESLLNVWRENLIPSCRCSHGCRAKNAPRPQVDGTRSTPVNSFASFLKIATTPNSYGTAWAYSPHANNNARDSWPEKDFILSTARKSAPLGGRKRCLLVKSKKTEQGFYPFF